MRFPLILAPGSWIVFDGPQTAGPAGELHRWWEGMTRTSGPPMFEPAPLLVTAPASATAAARQLVELVLPALTAGTSVVLDRSPAGSCPPLSVGRHRPDLVVRWPEVDGSHPARQHELARQDPDLVLLRLGNSAELSLQVFEAMARRGLYGWNVRS